jgi:Aldo/keto reductase family/Ham1 family
MTTGMTLHVIYRIACAGKSTTALQYADDNGIRTVISTDYLREVQRLYVPADQSPVLAKISHTAWELTGDPTPGGIVAGFTAHAGAVFPAVAAAAAKLPGALVAWFLETVGPRASSSWPQESPAAVSTALGYTTADGVRVFRGTANGSLATEPRGTSGFGYWRIVEMVEQVAAEIGATPAQIALAWLLVQGGGIVSIPGARKSERVEENAGADAIELSAGQLDRLNAVEPPSVTATPI